MVPPFGEKDLSESRTDNSKTFEISVQDAMRLLAGKQTEYSERIDAIIDQINDRVQRAIATAGG